jgi:peptidylprolyl isomerase
MSGRLEWTLVAGGPVSWAQASSSSSVTSKSRLPTAVELVESLGTDGAAFPFGVAGAVWAADGARVDPSADEVRLAGPAPTDAQAHLVLVKEKTAERPAGPTKQQLVVLGYIDEPSFQQCSEAAAYLNSEYSDEYAIKVEKYMGFEYERKRDAIANAVGQPEAKSLRVLVYNQRDNQVVSGEEFISRVTASTNFRLFDVAPEDPQSYQSLARVALRNHLASTGSNFAWFLVKIDDMVIGRIVFQLYSNICPKTCLNFLHLCRGDLPDAKLDGQPVKLHYKGSRFYRVVKQGWIQGGDITGSKTGNGGMSVYGKTFPDESFDVPHDDAGTLGMVNDGEHTNASSFYITTKKSAWMDRRYVAFGRVVEGSHVVQTIHDTPVRHNQTPLGNVVIDDCGDVPLDG